ncbi:MAG: hypothetical protein AAF543_00705 [Pseudomonadota bacterium]
MIVFDHEIEQGSTGQRSWLAKSEVSFRSRIGIDDVDIPVNNDGIDDRLDDLTKSIVRCRSVIEESCQPFSQPNRLVIDDRRFNRFQSGHSLGQ